MGNIRRWPLCLLLSIALLTVGCSPIITDSPELGSSEGSAATTSSASQTTTEDNQEEQDAGSSTTIAEESTTTTESTTDTAESTPPTEPESTATAAESTTTTAPPEETTTTTTAVANDGDSNDGSSNDAEPNLRFDVGAVVDWSLNDDGSASIQFDRFQRYPNGENGVDFDEEPGGLSASDVVYINENPRLRTYIVAPAAEALIADAAWFRDTCAGQQTGAPTFNSVSVAEFLGQFAGSGTVSLTFDSDRRVVLLRDQRNC